MRMRFLNVFAAAALFAAPTLAQVPNLDAHVSLRVEGRQLSEVVDYIRDSSGANIVVMQGGDIEISLDLTDIHWRDALDLAAEYAECVVEERQAGVLIINRPPRVTFVFPEADITEVIDAIAAISGANIVWAPEVTGTISLRLTDVPWRQALEVAVKTLGFTVVEDERGILRVVDPLSLQAQMETRSYQLRYVRPSPDFVPVMDTEFARGEYRTPTGQLEKDFPALGALSKALSPSGELDYVPGKNVFIVRDTSQVHDQIADLIERLDTPSAQVLVDVKFVSTNDTNLYNIGVDYGENGPQVGISGGSIPITFPFNLGSGGFEDVLIANPSGEGPFADPLLNFGNSTVPDTIFGALSFTGVQATLRLLQSDELTQVVQAPKIIAIDGRPATIFVGETIRYAEAKSEQGQAGGLQLSVSEASGSPVEVGFQLLIRPHIIPGTNSMEMQVIPKETSLSGTGNSALAPPGFDIFTIGASGLEGSIALPRTRSSTIVTSMLLDSGQTAVIGGLTTDTDFERISKVPFLGDIPILGRLFRNDVKNRERRSLLVFITPQILRSSSDTQRLLEKELYRRREEYDQELTNLLFGEDGPERADAPAVLTDPGVDDLDWEVFVDQGAEAPAEAPAEVSPEPQQ